MQGQHGTSELTSHSSSLISSFGTVCQHQNASITFGGGKNVPTHRKWQHPVVGKCFLSYFSCLFGAFPVRNINRSSAEGHHRSSCARKHHTKLLPLPYAASKPHEFRLSTYLYSCVVQTQGGEGKKSPFIAHFVFLKSTRTATRSVFPQLQRTTIIWRREDSVFQQQS